MTAQPEPPDPRPYVTLLLELASLGWFVTKISPDLEAPRVLWRITIVRYDVAASITVTDADPDDVLAELLRYASIDADPPHDSKPRARRAGRKLLSATATGTRRNKTDGPTEEP